MESSLSSFVYEQVAAAAAVASKRASEQAGAVPFETRPCEIKKKQRSFENFPPAIIIPSSTSPGTLPLRGHLFILFLSRKYLYV